MQLTSRMRCAVAPLRSKAFVELGGNGNRELREVEEDRGKNIEKIENIMKDREEDDRARMGISFMFPFLTFRPIDLSSFDHCHRFHYLSPLTYFHPLGRKTQQAVYYTDWLPGISESDSRTRPSVEFGSECSRTVKRMRRPEPTPNLHQQLPVNQNK